MGQQQQEEQQQPEQQNRSGPPRLWFFKDRPYFDSISTDPRAALIQLQIANSAPIPYDTSNGCRECSGYTVPGRRAVWGLRIGHELPVLGFQTGNYVTGRGVAPRGFGVGLWLPLGFQMVHTLLKDSNLISGEYLYGVMLKAQYGFEDSHIGLRLAIAHEAANTGAEFAQRAIVEFPTPIRFEDERVKLGPHFIHIQVSHDFWDLGASFEPNFRNSRIQLTLRGGYLGLFSHSGWYGRNAIYPILFDALQQSHGAPVYPSRRNYEPYGSLEILIVREQIDKPAPFLSLDVRDRTVFRYLFTGNPPISAPEDSQVSLNAMVGLRMRKLGAQIQPTFFGRFYHGVNPAGQFQSQKNYNLLAAGVQFDFK